MSEVKERCCHKVFNGSGAYRSFHPSQCTKTAKVEYEGKWYCSIHSPEGKAKRKARLQAKWDEERNQRERHYMRQQERADRETAMTAFCEGVTTETIRTLAANGETLQKWLTERKVD